MTDPIHAGETQPFQPVPPGPGPEPGAEPGPEPVVATEPVVGSGVKPGSNRPRSAMWVNVALALALVVAVGGIGFAAGRMTAPATLTAGGGNGFRGGQFPGGAGGGYFQDGAGGNGNGGGFRGLFGGAGASIQGTVESVSGSTLTLKLANGQTIQLSLDGTTTYHAQAAASAGDVKSGGTVIVRVQLNRGQGTGGPVTPSASDVTIVP